MTQTLPAPVPMVLTPAQAACKATFLQLMAKLLVRKHNEKVARLAAQSAKAEQEAQR